MATYTKFEQFVVDVGTGVHDLNGDTLKVYLTNATPDAAADAVKADLADPASQWRTVEKRFFVAPKSDVKTALGHGWLF